MIMENKFEVTNEVVYKAFIKLFINRKYYQDQDYHYYKFYRKGEIISDPECATDFEVLQTGIFKKVTIFKYDNDGNLKYPNDSMWMWHCSLQDVDFLIPIDQKEMERVFANIMFMSGMQENKNE